MPAKKHPRKREHKPHDAVFKAFFSDAKIAQNYLLYYTPPEIHRYIDFAFFHKIDTAFVSSRYGISFSDVLYETRLTTGAPARLLFLLEHKSDRPKQPVYLQLLDYLLQIWEDDLKNNRPLSFIIPIIVYHGEQGWEQRPFFDFFPNLPEGWKVFIPNFYFLLTDLSQISSRVIEEKEHSEYLINVFLALKFARDKRQIKENLKKILTFGESIEWNDREGVLLETLTFYIIKVTDMTQTEFKALKQQIPEPPSRKIVEIAREIFGDEVPRFLMEEWMEKFRAEVQEKVRAEVQEKVRAEVQEKVRAEVQEKVRAEVQEKVRAEVQEKVRAEVQEKVRAEVQEKVTESQKRDFTSKIILKFPDWNDAEVADFVGVTMEFVQQVRLGLTRNK